MHWFQLHPSYGGCGYAHLAVLPDWHLRSLCGELFAGVLEDFVVDVASPGAEPRENEVRAEAYCGGCIGLLAARTCADLDNLRPLGCSGLSLRESITARREAEQAIVDLQNSVANTVIEWREPNIRRRRLRYNQN